MRGEDGVWVLCVFFRPPPTVTRRRPSEVEGRGSARGRSVWCERHGYRYIVAEGGGREGIVHGKPGMRMTSCSIRAVKQLGMNSSISGE